MSVRKLWTDIQKLWTDIQKLWTDIQRLRTEINNNSSEQVVYRQFALNG